MSWQAAGTAPSDLEADLVSMLATAFSTDASVSTDLTGELPHVYLSRIASRPEQTRDSVTVALQAQAADADTAFNLAQQLIVYMDGWPQSRLIAGPSWLPGGYATTDDPARYALTYEVIAPRVVIP